MDQLKVPLARAEIRQIRALATRRNRDAQRRFLAEGVRVVEDLLGSGLDVALVVATSSLEDTERGRALLETAGSRGVSVRVAGDAELAELAGTETPQGVLAVAGIPDRSLGALDPLGPDATLLVLDAVQDPGNFGTLTRTAEALGAHAVLALPGTVDAWNPKAVRAAAGSSFRLPVVATDWSDAAPWLRARGFRVLAAAMDGAPLHESGGRAALVVGNEGAGVGDATLAHADARVGIPLRGRAESLNVAAAAAILLHQLLR